MIFCERILNRKLPRWCKPTAYLALATSIHRKSLTGFLIPFACFNGLKVSCQCYKQNLASLELVQFFCQNWSNFINDLPMIAFMQISFHYNSRVTIYTCRAFKRLNCVQVNFSLVQNQKYKNLRWKMKNPSPKFWCQSPRRPALVVMGRDSWSRGHVFESDLNIPDRFVHFYLLQNCDA